jgi:hypothetical protein
MIRSKAQTCLPLLGVRTRAMEALKCPGCGLRVYIDEPAHRTYHEAPVCEQYAEMCKSATNEGEVFLAELARKDPN